MPKFIEDKLKAEASTKGMKGKKAAQYVYGAMNNMGAMRGNQETPKGAAMEKKHLTGEANTYDSNRPKRQVQSRYSK